MSAGCPLRLTQRTNAAGESDPRFLSDAVPRVFDYAVEVCYRCGNRPGKRQSDGIPLIGAWHATGSHLILALELQPRVTVVFVARAT